MQYLYAIFTDCKILRMGIGSQFHLSLTRDSLIVTMSLGSSESNVMKRTEFWYLDGHNRSLSGSRLSQRVHRLTESNPSSSVLRVRVKFPVSYATQHHKKTEHEWGRNQLNIYIESEMGLNWNQSKKKSLKDRILVLGRRNSFSRYQVS